MNNLDLKLKEVSDKIGLSETITLDELIEAYFNIRETVKLYQKEFNDIVNESKEKLIKDFTESPEIYTDYIKLSKLKTMSLEELFRILE